MQAKVVYFYGYFLPSPDVSMVMLLLKLTFKVVTSQSYAKYPKIQPLYNSTFYVIAFITT